MFKAITESLLDELVARKLLRLIFGYRNHTPEQLLPADVPAGLFSGEREQFFQPEPVPQKFEYSDTASELADSICQRDFTFPSSVTSLFSESQQVICREWTAPGKATDRVVVGVDGIVQLGPRWFHRLAESLVPEGWDVIMLDAPYNHRRTPAGYRPGQLIAHGNLAHQLNVSRQSILDLWTLVFSLQAQGKKVGLVGVSYGAWMTTTVSQLADELLFLHALTPPLELAWILREGGAIVRAVSRGMGDDVPQWDEVVRISRPISPYHYVPRIPAERVFLHAAKYDRFIPTPRIRAYSERTGAQLIEHARGHVGATCRLDMADDIARRILETT